jgi:hypothetical protein
MAVTVLTAAEKRQLQDYIPALSDRTPGMDLYAKLVAMIADNNKIVSGTATCSGGSVVVQLGATMANAFVLTSAATAGSTAVVNGAGQLTITGAGTEVVSYIADAR